MAIAAGENLIGLGQAEEERKSEALIII